MDDQKRSVDDKRAQITKSITEKLGKPGDCDLCGEWFGRLVQGACEPCRDKHNLL